MKKPVKWTCLDKGHHHFYATSAVQWRVDADPQKLIEFMKRQKWSFEVFMVPGPVSQTYDIENYVPMVPGVQKVAFYKCES